MKKAIKTSAVLLSIIAMILLAVSISSASSLPDKFWVIEGDKLVITRDIPISVSLKNVGDDPGAKAVSTVGNSYTVDLKVLGLFPVKEARVEVVKENMAIPCGTTFGIKMYTEGVVIVGTSAIDTETGTQNPSKDAGIKEGDVIIKINGRDVSANEDVAGIFEASGGAEQLVEIKRKNETKTVKLVPAKSKIDGKYKGGLWVRDSSAGIGTMTFYEPQSGVFAGLGHGICDVDTGEIMPLMSGEIVPVSITGILRGENGAPGEIKGYFKQEISIGQLKINNETGVFGIASSPPVKGDAMPIAMKQQVKTGKAQIITTLADNKTSLYDIDIEKVNYNENNPTRNMVIKITDADLKKQTGGIIQGMSGSPIIQNGRIVGAVTHVFINDSERGYAIFAENMLKSAVEVPLKKAG